MSTPVNYLTIAELEAGWRTMTADEKVRANGLITSCSSEIRLKAKKRNKDFDEMFDDSEDLQNVTKAVLIKVVSEQMNKDVNQAPFSQFTESAGGYSLTGTYYSASMGTFFTKYDWKRLGLGCQLYGGLDLCPTSTE